jgi:hypothetical protein
LGIRNNDFRCDNRFHDDPPALLLRDGQPLLFDVVMGWG